MKGLFGRSDAWSPEPSTTPVLVAVTAGVVTLMYLVEWLCLTVISGRTSNHLVVNAYLLGLLVLAFLAWIGVRWRGLVTAASSGGFTLAFYALFARMQGELALLFVDAPWRETVFGSTGLQLLMLTRHLAFTAYVFGLAMVPAACLSEWHLARRGGRASRASAGIRD